jgi:hypothetical protein
VPTEYGDAVAKGGEHVEAREGGEKEGALLGIGLLMFGMLSIQFLIPKSIAPDSCKIFFYLLRTKVFEHICKYLAGMYDTSTQYNRAILQILSRFG